MSAAAKLKPAPDPTEAARGALAATFREIATLRAGLDANARDIDAARASIEAAEKEIELKREELEKTPALERRPLRDRLADLEEHLGDLRTHLQELRVARGHVPGSICAATHSLEHRLEMAQQKALRQRGDILKASPAALKMIERFHVMREELQGVEATIEAIAALGGIADRGGHGMAPSPNWWRWARPGFVMRCDPAWAAALAALETNPLAPLPGE